MDLLKRFNMIIDYPNNEVYLKQNKLQATPFKSPTGNRVLYLAGLSIILVIGLIVYILWKRKAKRMAKLLMLFFLLVNAQYIFSQPTVTIIRAKSQKVSIQDGWEGKTRYWSHLVKSQKPIEYHLAKNRGRRQVIFYTDLDSIKLDVDNESDYEMRVILNNKDTLDLRLTTKSHKITHIKPNESGIDTLPFKLNKNKQIIVSGSINNKRPMDFCLDLGARTVYIIGKDFDIANGLVIDGQFEDESVTGLSTEKTSSGNSIQLGNLSIANVNMSYIDEAGFLENGGALIGFNIFQDNIIEVDFDKNLLLIHRHLPSKAQDFSKLEIKQTTGGLYIPIKINNGKKQVTGWYFFDTGADNALTLDSRFAHREGLYNTMKVIGKAGIASSENRVIEAEVLQVPEVQIAGLSLSNVPTLLANESNSEADFEDGVMGIGIQSRLNFIIDFPNSKIYLKPNQYFKESFKKKDNKPGNIIVGLLTILGVSILIYKSYKRRGQ